MTRSIAQYNPLGMPLLRVTRSCFRWFAPTELMSRCSMRDLIPWGKGNSLLGGEGKFITSKGTSKRKPGTNQTYLNRKGHTSCGPIGGNQTTTRTRGRGGGGGTLGPGPPLPAITTETWPIAPDAAAAPGGARPAGPPVPVATPAPKPQHHRGRAGTQGVLFS